MPTTKVILCTVNSLYGYQYATNLLAMHYSWSLFSLLLYCSFAINQNFNININSNFDFNKKNAPQIVSFLSVCVIGFLPFHLDLLTWVLTFRFSRFSFWFPFCKCGELCKTNIHEYWETFRTHAILILSIRKIKKTGSCCDLKLSPWNIWDYIQLEFFILWLCSFDFRLLFRWVHYILLLQLLSNNFL